jgi:hypothetical protein
MRRAWLFALMLGGISATGCAGGYGYTYYAPVAPPPVRVEAYSVAPGPGYAWINGYWGYRGSGYVWTPGRWARPPHHGSVWADGRWERHGNRWGYHEGHWR